MRASLKIALPLCVSGLLLLGGCTRLAQSLYLNSCDRDIKNATRALEAARDDSRRAEGYSQRGLAYSGKGRYCRAFKLIAVDEYDHLFGLAVKDQNQPVVLAAGSAEVYYNRGRTYYDRAALEDRKDAKPWFDSAAGDFTKAVERDARHYMARDMLGLVHSSTGEWDKAIDDFTQEMELNPLGKARLADAFCERGTFRQRERNYGPAIADYEQAVEIGVTADGCSCDPYNPLVALYMNESREYDKAWKIVHHAQKTKKWIASELMESLKKDSRRNN